MIPILFQNDQIVLIDKPSGYLSVPSRTGQKDKRKVVGLILQDQLQKKIYPVHRLDFEVSGAMIYALSEQAHRSLNRAFENREIIKTYQAFSQGKGIFHVGDKGTWKCHMLKGKKRAYERPWGDLAVTDFELVSESNRGVYEWRLWPKTGRSHQLRFELFRHESPILGDSLYGGADRKLFSLTEGEQIALRAVSLRFDETLAQSLGFSPVVEVPTLSLCL